MHIKHYVYRTVLIVKKIFSKTYSSANCTWCRSKRRCHRSGRLHVTSNQSWWRWRNFLKFSRTTLFKKLHSERNWKKKKNNNEKNYRDVAKALNVPVCITWSIICSRKDNWSSTDRSLKIRKVRETRKDSRDDPKAVETTTPRPCLFLHPVQNPQRCPSKSV